MIALPPEPVKGIDPGEILLETAKENIIERIQCSQTDYRI